MNEPGNPSADVRPDDLVDFFDLGALATNWLHSYLTQAKDPFPANGASKASSILRWNPGFSQVHDIYLGTTSPPPFIATVQGPAAYDPGDLQSHTTYYWRVDERGGCTVEGQVWSFQTLWPFEGHGTSEDPFLVDSAEGLQAIDSDPALLDKHFKLTQDIDLSAYSGTEFELIGIGNGNWFRGVFDGDGHAISNFSYSSSANSSSIGLFGYVASGEIRNLRLANPTVDTPNCRYVGSLVGKLGDDTSIVNCHVSGAQVSGEDYVGGLVGKAGEMIYSVGGHTSHTAKVLHCSASASVVTGQDYVGGLVGFTGGYGSELRRCYSSGSVVG